MFSVTYPLFYLNIEARTQDVKGTNTGNFLSIFRARTNFYSAVYVIRAQSTGRTFKKKNAIE